MLSEQLSSTAFAEPRAESRRSWLYRIRPLVVHTSSAFERVMAVNVTSIFLGMRHVLPIMIAQRYGRIVNVSSALKGMHARRKGKIINISSIWGLVGAAFVTAPGYATTKGAVVNLTREMAVEYGSHNIQINAICPGFHRTGLGNSNDPEFIRLMKSHTPAGRVAEPSELQGTVIYLASSASDFTCGSVIVVDGGFLAQ